ncbi:MAG: DUF2306 domain-containing protein [Gemmatimonadota bacterium]
MTDEGVVILGIPIPSSSPVFLSILAIHVVAGLLCSVVGVMAMLAPKRPGWHPTAGSVYFWSLVVVFLTMTALSILRWPADNHLFAMGLASFGAGWVGRRARRRLWQGWAPVHVAGMALSYILLLTAFYVDNGPHLPLWRSLPRLVHWILPSLVGLPLLVWVLKRHHLLQELRNQPSAGGT